jgi:hypothetical protein
VTSPATSTTGAPDLPKYAPVPAIAKGAALNEHGYHVWRSTWPVLSVSTVLSRSRSGRSRSR